ncbi:hypothetical protein CBR_g51047 [Chara braunii]|uniref:GPI-anchored protein LLG1-like domain-containing protein n=1 Tax=Chara braunii TaxID=69332 RepID=A0A388K5W8_CHABU|nr:hypothetical protein CBR_g51047 [Chara braunii]|eukprot:GBG65452.1 hypothetical protein CBR_g51047 [Chara braunii]
MTPCPINMYQDVDWTPLSSSCNGSNMTVATCCVPFGQITSPLNDVIGQYVQCQNDVLDVLQVNGMDAVTFTKTCTSGDKLILTDNPVQSSPLTPSRPLPLPAQSSKMPLPSRPPPVAGSAHISGLASSASVGNSVKEKNKAMGNSDGGSEVSQGGGSRLTARVNLTFLFGVVSACIWIPQALFWMG